MNTEKKLCKWQAKFIVTDRFTIPYGHIKKKGRIRIGWVLPGGILCEDRVEAIQKMTYVHNYEALNESKYDREWSDDSKECNIDNPF